MVYWAGGVCEWRDEDGYLTVMKDVEFISHELLLH